MANRQLTKEELREVFRPIIEDVRARLREASHGVEGLFWALRRKLSKELQYDERDTPTARRQLKALKRFEQGGKCAVCGKPLPEKNANLKRLEAMLGYTQENTRLLCPECHYKVQAERGFA